MVAAFDAVIDNALYKGAEVEPVVRCLAIASASTSSQHRPVYLVREGIRPAFPRGRLRRGLMPSPKPNTYGYEEWYTATRSAAPRMLCVRPGNAGLSLYLAAPAMVNCERDHFHRFIINLRLKDGGPILVPSTPNYPLRHVYADDVVSAVIRLIETGQSKGAAYNISQDETVPLDEFLALVGDILGVPANVVRVRRDVLEANGFLPDCSPFSDRWMSELDNTRGKAELGITYTRCAPISKRSSLITTNRRQLGELSPPPRRAPDARIQRLAGLAVHRQGLL